MILTSNFSLKDFILLRVNGSLTKGYRSRKRDRFKKLLNYIITIFD
jgi:hypothetical protein